MLSLSAPLARGLVRLAKLVLVVVLLVPRVALGRDVPPLGAHVNDTAHLLSQEGAERLEQKLAAYEQKSGHQFALLTIDSLNGDALEDFSIRVVEAWKLGKKGKDDGLLLLIVPGDHKLRIEVGYGLEGDVTDAFSARVIRNVLTPALRAGKAEQGVSQAFDVLMQKASGEAVPDSAVGAPKQDRDGGSPLPFLVLILFLLPFILPLLLGRGGRRRSGIALGGLGGLGGFGGGWGGSGRGGWGGWGGGGGGGGGGGFSGGGGGGGFGGGGASGSW